MPHDPMKCRRRFFRKGQFCSYQSNISPVSIANRSKSRSIKKNKKTTLVHAPRVSKTRTSNYSKQSINLIVSLMQKRRQLCSKCSSLPTSKEQLILITKRRKRNQATVFMNIRTTCADYLIKSRLQSETRCLTITCWDLATSFQYRIQLLVIIMLMVYRVISLNSQSNNQSKIQASRRQIAEQISFKLNGKHVLSHAKTKIVVILTHHILTYQRTIENTICALIISHSGFQRCHLNLVR